MIPSNKNPLIIILLGKSGSGKGTQADLLIKKFGFACIGTGDLLRERKEKNDFTGNKIDKILSQGGLMPTSVILELWLGEVERLKSKRNFKGLVMDGNPRKILEAYVEDEAFNWYDWKNVKAFLVHISDKEAVRRLTKRRICRKCGQIIPFIGESKKLKKCPKCGGRLIRRADDTLALVRNRLKWFKTDVEPIVSYYRKTGRLIKINGEQDIKDVFKDILKCLIK